jgi:hypothetical protein
MNNTYAIEERVIERAMELYPEIEELVAFSTPVVSFGNPQLASVATLGINPSSSEFQIGNGNKAPLGGAIPKRLVDTEVLGINNPTSLTREQAIKVIEGCYQYFYGQSPNPYEWFLKLEEFILKPAGFTYYGQHATACHLDLVQWATDPVWDSIASKSTKELLLKQDKEFLRYQLTSYNFEYVFLNGSTAVNQFKELGIAKLEQVHTVTANSNGGRHTVVKGESGGTAFFGWGINTGAKYASKAGLKELVEFIENSFKQK